MRIISRKAFRLVWNRPGRSDAEQPLRAWIDHVKREDGSSPAEVRRSFRNASIVGKQRIVFNIAGNKYRLVAKANYLYRILYVRFIGTHAEYDRMDVEEI